MKHSILKFFILASLCVAIGNSYALQIKVQSSSKKITGLGFKVNGKQHGGLGTHYETKGMPKGKYEFGLRDNGKDIPCKNEKGEKSIKITKSTKAVLVYKNGVCTVKIH